MSPLTTITHTCLTTAYPKSFERACRFTIIRVMRLIDIPMSLPVQTTAVLSSGLRASIAVTRPCCLNIGGARELFLALT
jgi:hypothetical protein